MLESDIATYRLNRPSGRFSENLEKMDGLFLYTFCRALQVGKNLLEYKLISKLILDQIKLLLFFFILE